MYTLNDVKSQKMEYLRRVFQYRSETLYNCYTHRKVPQYVHRDISMLTQWAPGPLLSKGKTRVFFLQEVLYLLLMFIQWVWANMGITPHKQKKVHKTYEQQI